MLKREFILFFSLFLCVSLTMFGQTKQELEAQRRKLNTEIKKVNKLLFETKKKERNA